MHHHVFVFETWSLYVVLDGLELRDPPATAFSSAGTKITPSPQTQF